MKKVVSTLIIVFVLIGSHTHAQIKKNVTEVKEKEQNNTSCETSVYKLFPTENMWTFIKLNTRNGQMWQVQYDVNGKNRNEKFLNLLPLIDKKMEANGRFTLYPTKNIYTFILLDQIDGKMWQVQWSFDLESRFVLPIELIIE